MDSSAIQAVQAELARRNFYLGRIDGQAGPKTTEALLEFAVDAMNIEEPEGVKTIPPFAVMSAADRRRIFGTFRYSPQQGVRKGQSITIVDGWEDVNISRVFIPQLAGKPLFSEDGQKFAGHARFHRLAARQLVDAWHAVEQAGLLHLVLTVDGFFNPRFITSSTTALSNHAWGTAFDINAEWNGYGHKPAQPAQLGQKGYLLPLVEIFHKHGFYWGGNFASSCDAMHFEVARLL